MEVDISKTLFGVIVNILIIGIHLGGTTIYNIESKLKKIKVTTYLIDKKIYNLRY